jgi:hypothetical protein
MLRAPIAIRQIGGHNWEAGINNIIYEDLENQIISWQESGWVYSMHLLNEETDASGNHVVTVRQDVYKLDKYPPYVGNILEYILCDDSDRFKKTSDVCVYIK